MCGNLGLLLTISDGAKVVVKVVPAGAQAEPEPVLLDADVILEAMIAKTEVRGGQAGGLSSFQYADDALVPASTGRVRTVARKRFPLSADMGAALRKHCPIGKHPGARLLSVVGHTRFATSSMNVVPELHPHDWYDTEGHHWDVRPLERVYVWDQLNAQLVEVKERCIIHVTHNGDFDAMNAYNGMLLNSELGRWLEHVLRCPNSTQGDSPKLAGMLELLRVQGRWGPAARLGWVRGVCTEIGDATGGKPLDREANLTAGIDDAKDPHARRAGAPPSREWERNVAPFFEQAWRLHGKHVVAPVKGNPARYVISLVGQNAFENVLSRKLSSRQARGRLLRGAEFWSQQQVRAFVHHTVRGFLRNSLHAALTELISRSHGTFGVQAHCSLEPGVVVLASKGQPMMMAFSDKLPIVLFGSEASATRVPVTADGQPLPSMLVLDEVGEIVRVGQPGALFEGSYTEFGRASPDKLRRMASKELVRQSTQQIDVAFEMVALEMERIEAARAKALSAGRPRRLSLDGVVSRRKDGSSVEKAEAPLQSASIDALGVGSIFAGFSAEAGRLFRRKRKRSSITMPPDAWKSADELSSLALPGGVIVRAYSLSRSVEVSADELRKRVERLSPMLPDGVSLDRSVSWLEQESPFKQPASVPAGKGACAAAADLVARDLAETPAVLRAVERSWRGPSLSGSPSPNWLAAEALAAHLLPLMLSRRQQRLEYIDLLIGGIETSLWQCEQFAADLHSFLPYLHVRCVSSNKLLGLGGASPRKTFFAGGETPSVDSLRHAAILLVSHSGQTFPTLHATRHLERLAPGCVWLLTGTPRSQMERSLANAYEQRGGAKLQHRTLLSCAGDRPAEPATAAVAAMQYTLTQLMLHIATHVREHAPKALTQQLWERPSSQPFSFTAFAGLGPRSGGGGVATTAADGTSLEPLISLTDACLQDMRDMMKATCAECAQIVGTSVEGEPIASPTHDALVTQGRRWGRHVREPWVVLCLVAIYLLVSVTLACPLAAVLGQWALLAAGLGESVDLSWSVLRPTAFPEGQALAWQGLGFGLRLADAIIYINCGRLLTWFLRYAEGRPMWGRHGKRTLLIIDTPTNHQMLEAFVSKLFAQSYSFCSIEVHGAAGVDHFVHRHTHRVCRGLLLAVGRPDGRLCCLAKTEASLLLAVKQAFFVQNPRYPGGPLSGNAPEIFSVGHNPLVVPDIQTNHVPLSDMTPISRKQFLDEAVYLMFVSDAAHSSATSMLRSIVRKAAATLTRSSISSSSMSTPRLLARGRSFDMSLSSNLLANGSSVSVAGDDVGNWRTKLIGKEAPYGAHYVREMQKAAVVEPAVDSLVRRRLAITLQHGNTKPIASSNPHDRLAFADMLDASTKAVLDRQLHIQRFYECRLASLERYLAFCVTFHAMAKMNTTPWFRSPWDLARSQSNLRVATTASPISSSDVDAEGGTLGVESWFYARKAGSAFRKNLSFF